MFGNNGSSRVFIPIQKKFDRVVLLLHMNCFFCQVEEQIDPSLKGQPLAVVQYNRWYGGGIIAVNYAAREQGITRHMLDENAKKMCPNIRLVTVPNIREKVDLSKYRAAGEEVAKVLQKYTPLLNRASIDEAYLDITDSINKRMESLNMCSFLLGAQELLNTYAVGYTNFVDYIELITTCYMNIKPDQDVPAELLNDIRLLLGAAIACEIRADVKSATGYDCSVGIAHNKILAKLACGINKPNKQTVLPMEKLPGLFETLPVGKIRGLGGKFGEELCGRLGIRFLGELQKFTKEELQKKFDEKNGTWLYQICRGIDLEAVTHRFHAKSIGCCKDFHGHNSICGINTLKHWLNELGIDICERLKNDIIENNRKPTKIVLTYIQEFDGKEISSSRSAPLNSYNQETLVKTCLTVIKANTKKFFYSDSETRLNNPITHLGISMGNFLTISIDQNKLQECFANQLAKQEKTKWEGTIIETSGIKKERNTNVSAIDINKTSDRKKTILDNFLLGKKEILNIDTANILKSEKIPKNNLTNGEDLDEHEHFFLNEQKNDGATEMLKKDTQNIFNVEGEKLQTDNLENTFNIKRTLEKNYINRPYNVGSEICPKEYNLKELRNELDTTQNGSERSCNENIKSNVKSEKCPTLFSSRTGGEVPSSHNVIENSIENLQKEADTYSTSAKKPKYTDIPHLSETLKNSVLHYQNNYAEFALPELRPELVKFVKCDICGVKITNDDCAIQIHQDHHFAQQLRDQQRVEYSEEMKSKIMSHKSPPNKSKKKKQKSHASQSIKKNIKTFLSVTEIPVLTLEPSTSLQAECERNSNETEICQKCNMNINKSTMAEHKDFHFAQDLQNQLSQVPVQRSLILKKINRTASKATHRNTISPPITQFFSKSNR